MPSNISQLRSLFGDPCYYRIVIPNLSEGIHSMSALLKKSVAFASIPDQENLVSEMFNMLTEKWYQVFLTEMGNKMAPVFFNCTQTRAPISMALKLINVFLDGPSVLLSLSVSPRGSVRPSGLHLN